MDKQIKECRAIHVYVAENEPWVGSQTTLHKYKVDMRGISDPDAICIFNLETYPVSYIFVQPSEKLELFELKSVTRCLVKCNVARIIEMVLRDKPNNKRGMEFKEPGVLGALNLVYDLNKQIYERLYETESSICQRLDKLN